jgi:leucyl-tRNA synthetase
MSKSRGNIVDPDEIIAKYGADTMRLFILFAAPPETELEWEERGTEGAFRFLARVWRIQENLKDKADPGLVRLTHKTIKKVTDDFGEFKFNTAIAAMMELVNAIYQSGADKQVYSSLILMLSPIAPHFCEEIWQSLGNSDTLLKAGWPKFDPGMLVDERVTMAVQVNGKVRSKIEVPSDMSDEDIKTLALSDEKVKQWLDGKPVKNIVVVPKRLVSIVA